jgi:hypothetical protein
MTVHAAQPRQVAEVVRACRDMGLPECSPSQPAAFVGDRARWKDEFRAFTTDELWAQDGGRRGAGACTRTPSPSATTLQPHGLRLLRRLALRPALDEDDESDARALDASSPRSAAWTVAVPRALLAAKLAARPGPASGSARRVSRAGRGASSRARAACARCGPTPARADLRRARLHGRRGRATPPGSSSSAASDRRTPAILATQERLQACSYAMAHPEDGTLVPACAQHAVLDPLENARLARELPLLRG